MDRVGRSRRPAGRNRPGLILKVETLPRRARDRELRERVGLQLLLSQRRLPRQTRPLRGNPPSFLGPLCSPLLDGALVRLGFRRLGFGGLGFLGRRLFVDDDGGTAERRDSGRGDVAFE